MRSTAIILLFVFCLVQLAPAISGLLSPVDNVCMAGEENRDEIKETESQENNEYTCLFQSAEKQSHPITISIHLAERICPAPYPEQLTPPPNFC
jgi:hypothetical protein